MSENTAQHPETDDTTANGDSDSIAERERLELEKLRLDNEEQQARITQLSLKWWQRPKAVITMLVPLVPTVFAGIVWITDFITTEIREAAEFEKQKYVNENQKLELAKERTSLETMRLKYEQKQLQEAKEHLNARISELVEAERALVDRVFRRFSSVTEIGGQIMTAKTYTSANAAFQQFTVFQILGIVADLKLDAQVFCS